MGNRKMSVVGKLIFPPRCAVCRRLLPFDGEGGESVMCRDCRGKWELEKLALCPVCGRAMMDCACMPDRLRGAGCSELIRLTAYDPSRPADVVNSAVNNIKRINDRETFDFFAAQLLSTVKNRLSELELDISDMTISFCPRRRSAKRLHGFDQSEILARSMAKQGGAEFAELLERRRFVRGSEQKKLDSSGRFENARRSVGLTSAGRAMADKRVLLVDDVVTTGSTVAACAAEILSAGAQMVVCACIATACLRGV